jgi:hypothetical protein
MHISDHCAYSQFVAVEIKDGSVNAMFAPRDYGAG